MIAIGIDDYQNGVRTLGKAVSDAIAMADIIKAMNPTENVKYYFSLASRSKSTIEVEQEVKERFKGKTFPSTNDGFCKLLNHLKKTVGKNERIILYFAGHGIALPFARIPKEDGNSIGNQLQVTLDDKPQGYLLFQDAEKGNRNTYMKMDNLIELLKEVECRHGLIILDCCFAGAVEWSLYRSITRQIGDELVTPSILDRYITRNAWQILTSSSENQVTNEYLSLEEQLDKSNRGADENSPFVISLKKALIDGEADYLQSNGKKRGFIHATRLIDYLREEVESKSTEANKLQTPCLLPFPLKHEQTAEFVLILGGNNLDKVKENLIEDPDIKQLPNPYMGLESYSPDDSHIFFGRERQIEKLENLVNFEIKDSTPEGSRQEGLIKQLKKNFKSELESLGRGQLIEKLKNLAKPESKDLIKQLTDFEQEDSDKLLDKYVNKFPLTVVSGASGSGKSSLVKAGLIPKMFPKLKDLKLKDDRWVEFRPGRAPGTKLKQALKELQIDKISHNEKRLLVIDQFEEVETQCEDSEEKTVFWEELMKLLKGKKVDVVLTLRSDFETTLRSQFESALSKNLKVKAEEVPGYWVRVRFPVPMMEREELEKVITKPAEKHTVFFEDEENDDGRTLVAQLIHEVTGMPGALPLISVALNSMYENFKKRYVNSLKGDVIKREITWEDYNSLGGGVPGALRRKATEEFNKLKYKFNENDDYDLWFVTNEKGETLPEEVSPEVTEGRRKMLRWAMLRMLTRKGSEIVRRQVLKSELIYKEREYNDYSNDALGRFASPEVRLLVSGGEGDDAYYEPAHDALVREWDYIAAWLEGKKEPDNAPQESTPKQEHGDDYERENSTQESQPKSNFWEKLLTPLRNSFFRNGRASNQDPRPLNLILLQELNSAANTWKNPALLNDSSEPSSTTNQGMNKE